MDVFQMHFMFLISLPHNESELQGGLGIEECTSVTITMCKQFVRKKNPQTLINMDHKSSSYHLTVCKGPGSQFTLGSGSSCLHGATSTVELQLMNV